MLPDLVGSSHPIGRAVGRPRTETFGWRLAPTPQKKAKTKADPEKPRRKFDQSLQKSRFPVAVVRLPNTNAEGIVWYIICVLDTEFRTILSVADPGIDFPRTLALLPAPFLALSFQMLKQCHGILLDWKEFVLDGLKRLPHFHLLVLLRDAQQIVSRTPQFPAKPLLVLEHQSQALLAV